MDSHNHLVGLQDTTKPDGEATKPDAAEETTKSAPAKETIKPAAAQEELKLPPEPAVKPRKII